MTEVIYKDLNVDRLIEGQEEPAEILCTKVEMQPPSADGSLNFKGPEEVWIFCYVCRKGHYLYVRVPEGEMQGTRVFPLEGHGQTIRTLDKCISRALVEPSDDQYVNHEVANLLEPYYDEPVFTYWHNREKRLIHSQSPFPIRNRTDPCFFGPAAPTLQSVIDWLKGYHGIAIEIAKPDKRHKDYAFGVRLMSRPDGRCGGQSIEEDGFSSWEEAANKAIKVAVTKIL